MVPTEADTQSWPDYGHRPMHELLDEHAAKMIGRICTAAAEGHRPGQSLLVNHRDLTARLQNEVLPFLQVSATPAERESITQCLHEDAKHPGQPFSPDSSAKRAEASPVIKQAAAEHAQVAYERVEALAGLAVSFSSSEAAAAPATGTA